MLFARFWSPAPTSQTPATECFRSKTELLFCKVAEAPFLVPNVLLLAVPLDGGRVPLTVAPPIIRVARSPLLRAIQADLPVLRVRYDPLAVILSAAAALAAGVAAHRLGRMILRGLEDPLTVAASPFDHTGGCRILRSAMFRREI